MRISAVFSVGVASDTFLTNVALGHRNAGLGGRAALSEYLVASTREGAKNSIRDSVIKHMAVRSRHFCESAAAPMLSVLRLDMCPATNRIFAPRL